MTVFMSPRTNYVLGRHSTHSVMAWIVIVFLLIGVGGVAVSYSEETVKPSPIASTTLLVLGGAGLFSRNGRRCIRRIVGETFYGSLHSFTGVCSSNYDDIVGGGGPAKEL